MRSYRGSWLRSWVLGAILVTWPAVTTTVHAQPGFGADPFWPYNNQYTAYTTPLGPADPGAGQGSAFIGRQGNFSANQFQQYLDGLGAPGRGQSDRAGVGVPYFRGSVDPTFGDREYRPNAASNQRFEDKQKEVTQKYFLYFSETDPKKRAAYLKEYKRVRHESNRMVGGYKSSPSGILDHAAENAPIANSARSRRDEPTEGAVLPREPGTRSRSRTSASRTETDDPDVKPGRALRPAPPIPGVPGSPSSVRPRTPSSSLNRALGTGSRPSSTSSSPRPRRTSPITLPNLSLDGE